MYGRFSRRVKVRETDFEPNLFASSQVLKAKFSFESLNVSEIVV